MGAAHYWLLLTVGGFRMEAEVVQANKDLLLVRKQRLQELYTAEAEQ